METGGLVGVFLGGALPWLEAVVVVPAGIVAGLDPVLVVLAGVAGNLATVAVATYAGSGLRERWVRWRTRRRARRDTVGAQAAGVVAAASGEPPQATASARQDRVRRVFERWGLPGLAVVGPLGIGTQVAALVAVSLGAGAHTTMAWIGTGTLVWAVVAAVLAEAGLSVLGVGG